MPNYPLLGPNVKALHEYIKFEEEEIHLGLFGFDYREYFGLRPDFNYDIDFVSKPITPAGPEPDNYGLIYTCEHECNLNKIVSKYNAGDIIAGPAIRVVDGSTKDIARLYALIYDKPRSMLIFGRWDNASLRSFDKILTLKPISPLVVDDELIIEEVLFNEFKSFVNATEHFDISDSAIGLAGKCFGYVILQTITQVSKPVQSSSSGVTARFFYCPDGINVVQNLLPVALTPTGDGFSNTFDTNLDLTVKSGLDGDKCYGFLRAQIENHGEIAPAVGDTVCDYMYAQFIWQPLSGNARTGLGVRVDESKADPNDFTGFAAIIDGPRIFICAWVNSSLSFYHHVLATINYQMSSGEILSIEYNGHESVTSTGRNIRVFTKKIGEGFVVRGTVFDIEAIIPKPAIVGNRRLDSNVGIVWIGNDAPGLHTAKWLKPSLSDVGGAVIGVV